MQKVNGIGGFLFRGNNPEVLAKWYRENLGITSGEWHQEAGTTAFQPFDRDSEYFPKGQAVMLDFRVDDLDAMLEQLKANGVKIADEKMEESFGKFAWCYDPEGNKIELWQPMDQ